MSTELLQTGVEAVKQGSYSEGIGVLEEVCRQVNPGSKDCMKAQMWLVKAYHKTGQSDRAIGLCQQMTESEFPQVQSWANKTLPSLSKKSQTVTPKQVTSATKADSYSQAQAPKEELLEMGSKAIGQKDYAEAIGPLL